MAYLPSTTSFVTQWDHSVALGIALSSQCAAWQREEQHLPQGWYSMQVMLMKSAAFHIVTCFL